MPTSAPGTKAMVVTITPQLAREWLEMNIETNRPVRQRTVQQYALHMKQGEWSLTGQPIIFSNGNLLDGQHRLWGCVSSDTSFRSLVVWDVDIDAFEYLDTGQKRSLGDVLHFRNHANSRNLAAIVRQVIVYEHGWVHTSNLPKQMTQAALVQRLEKDSELFQASLQVGQRAIANGFNRTAAASAWICIALQENEEVATEFIGKALDGINLQLNDPRLTMRKYVAVSKKSPTNQFIGWLKCWNAWSQGRTLRSISAYKNGDPFPTLNKMKESTNVIR